MRNKFANDMDYDDAQTKAAKIYNSKHPNAPVTGKSEGKKKSKKKSGSFIPAGKMRGC